MNSRWKLILVLCLALVVSVSSLGSGQELVNMEFKQAPLVDVFQILGQLGGYNVLVDPSVSGQVSFSLKDLAVEEALDLVARTTGYRYQLVGNTLVIASAERLKSEFGTEDFTFVVIQHVGVDAAQRLVSMIVPGVKSYTDPALNLLVLFGPTTDLETAKLIVKQYDQKAFAPPEPVTGVSAVSEPKPKEVASRAIPVYYGDGLEIVAALRQNWPHREFSWDEKTQNVLGQTLLAEWAEVEFFVQERDLPRFQVKGILGSADQIMVLVEFRGVTTLLKQGEALHDWTVTSVEGGDVEFSQGGQKFTVGMGR